MEKTCAVVVDRESADRLVSTWRMGCLSAEEISNESVRINKAIQIFLNDEIEKATEFNANQVYALGMKYNDELLHEGIDPDKDSKFKLKSTTLEEMRVEIPKLVAKLKRTNECKNLCSKAIEQIQSYDRLSYRELTIFLLANNGTEESLKYFNELLGLKKSDYMDNQHFLIKYRSRREILSKIMTLECNLKKTKLEKDELLKLKNEAQDLENFLAQNKTMLIRNRTFEEHFDLEKKMRRGALKLSEAKNKSQFFNMSSMMIKTPITARISNGPPITATIKTPVTNTPLPPWYPAVTAQETHSSTPRVAISGRPKLDPRDQFSSGRRFL